MSLLPNLTSWAAAHSTLELKWDKMAFESRALCLFNDADAIVGNSVL